MQILVLGGTSFIGRHVVEAALLHGHRVTLFHRGRTNASLFPAAEHRYGDRATGDYRQLDRGTWDAVVDMTAYLPRYVTQVASVLTGRVGHYVQVSSISAYDPAAATGGSEDDPLHPPLAIPTETITPDTYGLLKAACEREAGRSFGDAVAIVRPTYVAGPHDPTDRFTYWTRRMARGGDVLVTTPDRPIQIVDVRDLAGLLLAAATQPLTGAFDAAGAPYRVADLLTEMTPTGVPVRLRPVDERALEGSGVMLPLLPVREESVPLFTRPALRARAAGLDPRPPRETAAATRAWDVERGLPPLQVGPTPDREAEIISDLSDPESAPAAT